MHSNPVETQGSSVAVLRNAATGSEPDGCDQTEANR